MARAVLQAEPDRPRDDPVVRDEVGHHEPARLGDAGGAGALAAEALRDGGAGVEEVDVDAARHPVPGGADLAHPAVRVARPPDPPPVHLADALDRALAQEGGEALVDEAAAGLEGVGEVPRPVVRPLLGDGGRDRHLGHDRRPAAPDHALVGEEHPGARPRGRNCRIHPGPARPDHQHIRLDPKRLHGRIRRGMDAKRWLGPVGIGAGQARRARDSRTVGRSPDSTSDLRRSWNAARVRLASASTPISSLYASSRPAGNAHRATSSESASR